MGPTQINGLPAHVLLVHVVVVLVPLTALALIGSAVRPRWIRRLGVVLPLLALVTLVSVPITTHAGEWLEKHTASTPLLRKHTELGGGLAPWVVSLFVLATALWWWDRRSAASPARTGPSSVALPYRVTVAVVCAAVAVGSVVEVYRIGDSGAKAAWQGQFSQQPVSGQGR